MATQKLYAGAKLRETRTRLGLTQKAFAERLGVSLPYLNQMENNHRPVSSAVILALVQEFDRDLAIEHCIVGRIYLAHTAATQFAKEREPAHKRSQRPRALGWRQPEPVIGRQLLGGGETWIRGGETWIDG